MRTKKGIQTNIGSQPNPSNHRKPRLGGRSARVRESVLKSTLESLINNGYEGLSVANVAKAAKVNESSIYRRWGTKDRLVVATLLEYIASEIQIPDTGSFRQDAIELLRYTIKFLQSPLGSAIAQVGVVSVGNEDSWKFKQLYWKERMEHIHVVFQRAIERGELKPDINVTLFIETLIGPLYVRLFLTEEKLDENLPEQIVDLFLGNI